MKITDNILQTLEVIPGRFYFYLVEKDGVYSVYHKLDGGYGQKNFGTDKEQAEVHFDNQKICQPEYKQLIGKRDKLIYRVAPISNKLDRVTRQIDALIIR